ncbi:MAG: hypothetical protein V3T56_03255, partial [Gemmatimonadales bacterium]
MRTTKYLRIGLLLVLVAMAACSDDPLQAPDNRGILQGDGDRITVNNDANALAQRVSRANVPLEIAMLNLPAMAALRDDDDSEDDGPVFKLFLVASVAPPVVGDVTLQATHIVVRGNNAIVSYNVQGPLRAGGVDVFNIKHVDDVELVSQAVFEDTDVSAIDFWGTKLYLAEATGDGAFATPAVLETIGVRGNVLTDETERVDLASYVGTGVVAKWNSVFATSGDLDGGLTVFDRRTMELKYFRSVPDARAVDIHRNEVVVMKGTPGAIHIFDKKSGDLKRVYESGGATIAESKSTVEVARGRIWYAAGEEGMRVLRYRDGKVLGGIPVPDIDGVDPENEVTNALSLHDHLVFMANGGAGLLVARASCEVEGDNHDEQGEDDDEADWDLSFQVLGNVVFPGGESANFVGGKGNLVFVATGTGGLHIIKIVGDH